MGGSLVEIIMFVCGMIVRRMRRNVLLHEQYGRNVVENVVENVRMFE